MVGSFVALEETVDAEVKDKSGRVKAHNRVYIGGAAGTAGEGPQAYLVEPPLGQVGTAHFHNVDQYQVFFPSPGATYKHAPITSPLFHYSDAHTVYGPYAAGTERPLQLLTLRARHSSVTAFVPEDRDKLPKAARARRHVALELGPARSLQPGETDVRVLIDPYPDGLAAYVLEAGPDTIGTVPAAARSAGQYCCVLDGAVVADGVSYPSQAVRWDPPGADGNTFTAGPSGLRLLVARFPDPPTAQ